MLFFPGCNLKCPYCHNPQIVHHTADFVPLDEILTFLETRKNVLTGVVLTGGEPLLYDNVGEIIKGIHKLGLKVKLDTNGTFPEKLEKLTPDYIAVDLKSSPLRYPLLGLKKSFDETIKRTITWLKNSGIDHEVRTTAAPLIFTEEDLKELIPLLTGVRNYYISNFRQGDILIPEYNNNTPYSEKELLKMQEICMSAKIPCNLR